ncbi:hypothetical protein CLV62_10390 [Dysgonomonas alginatilytica]|uniref:Beta-carotene 15,15'-monooxygenase n=1 Tax=Dysgonomonas alginatilytica TaxID=1605892 RepID=A0A2V3PU35_9BACT|nr:hypothetical protein [Dysgonomonas alginatilytica]PXV67417.1 hypothetical protein CLV62_10390 [Dysgonomonas alginatilytica]
MDAIRQYKKSIVENKNLVLFSIILTFLIRFIIFYLVKEAPGNENIGTGYLWTGILTQLLSNGTISFIVSTFFVFSISFYASQLNAKHGLIRNRTYLLYVFGSLIFSSHPVFIYMTHYYVSAFAFLICVDILYSSYQDKSGGRNAYALGFVLGISSLFSFFTLMYLPLFWMGFRMMRIFNFKTFIISILGIATIYWLSFAFFLWQNNIAGFLEPFNHLYPILNGSIENTSFTGESLLVAIALILLIIISLDYQTNSFRDKIRIRANIQFLHLASLFSILTFFFIIFDPTLNLYMISCSMSILLAHFFTLVEQKWKVITFYILILVYFLCCFLNLLN